MQFSRFTEKSLHRIFANQVDTALLPLGITTNTWLTVFHFKRISPHIL